MTSWPSRLRAASIHVGISLFVAALAAALVFGLWYPYPYREVSGGRELFTIMVSVDVVLGPLLTLAIFNRAKPWKELRRDLAIIAMLQIAGLGYGLWTVFSARPVHLVFEIDRFRVVHAVDIPVELLSKTPPGVVALPLTGPTSLAVRPFHDENEKMQATMVALQGIALSARPDLWQRYDEAQAQVRAAARPVAELKTRFPERSAELDRWMAGNGRPAEAITFLPLAGRKQFWTVLLDAGDAQIVGFLPIDSF